MVNIAVNEVREDLLAKIRKQELRLNSLELQAAFEQENDPAKKATFVQERRNYVIARTNLENAILENIAASLNLLAPDLEDGLEDLEAALQNIKNTVEIMKTIKLVTGIVARIVTIV